MAVFLQRVFPPLLMQTESSGTVTDFLAQLQGQSEILSLFVFFVLLLIMTVLAFILLRVVRARRASEQKTPTAPTTSLPTYNASAAMPDLDMLLATPTPTRETPSESTRQPGVVNIQMADGRFVEATEMLIIARDRHSDNLLVQIGNSAYDGTEGGVDPEFRRRFVKLMRELSEVAPTLSKASGNPAPSQAPQPPAPTPQQAPPLVAVNADALSQELDLAGQIEMFLQQKLMHSPEFSQRGLHVHSAPGGGVQIEVDGQTFPSVDEVTDPEVQAYLKQTIAEWQATRI